MTKKTGRPEVPERSVESIHDPCYWGKDRDRLRFRSEVRLSKMRAEACLMLMTGVEMCDAFSQPMEWPLP
jgi:hypothetical protein